MKQRKNAEDGVFGADVDDLEHTLGFGIEIAVREHYTLGIAGGARGVENHGDVVGCDRYGMEGRGPCGEDLREVQQAVLGTLAVDENEFYGKASGGFIGDEQGAGDR